jgi:hypothetical protein
VSELDFGDDSPRDSPSLTTLQMELAEERELSADLRSLLSSRSQEVANLEETVSILKETCMADSERLVLLSDELVALKLKMGELQMENETMCADGAALLLKVPFPPLQWLHI